MLITLKEMELNQHPRLRLCKSLEPHKYCKIAFGSDNKYWHALRMAQKGPNM
jgi:hypothetical protein